MTTIGDVLMIFGAIALISISLFCGMVLFTLLLPTRAAKMANFLDHSPGQTLGIGSAIVIPTLTLILILASLHNPAIKVLALLVLLVFLGCAALGGAGLTRLVAERIRNSSQNETLSMLGSSTRAAGLIVGAVNIPLLGWMFLAPLFLCVSIGSFAQGYLSRKSVEVPWQSANS
jgi:hypothetical protein